VARAVTQRAEVDEAPAPATLSVCVMTAGPGARVAGLLRLLRDAADELVVALDDRADAETAGVIAAVADRVVRYPYREPVDRPLRWLFSLCRSEWILNLDDDEVPGAELVEALPALVRARDVTHFWLLRRWLWPDTGSMLAEHPWSTDYQLRLVRNDPLLLRFPSETHRPLEALGPHRFIRLPLYHADLVLNPLAQREVKARKYEALRPGKRVAGGPMNHVFHLPERRPGAAVEPLPAEDNELVRRVLGAKAGPAREAPPAARASEAEIDELWAGRGPAHDGRLELLDEPARLCAAEQRTFDVRVANLGATTWPWGERGEPEVRLSYQWLDADGDLVGHGLRTPLPADLVPGESQVVPLHVLAPHLPGRYRLRLDLVHEHVAWFGNRLEREVVIEPRQRVAIFGHAADVRIAIDRLTDGRPELEPLVLTSQPSSERFGPPRAPDLREYLLHDTVPGRWRDWPAILRRTAMLFQAVRRRRSGREVRPLLHGGEEFLDELASCSSVLPVSPPAPGLRERLLEWATLRVARRLGVRRLAD
jgi:hypothetical protein